MSRAKLFKRFQAILPWLFFLAAIAFVVGRIVEIMAQGPSQGAFLAGAALSALQLGSLYALLALGYTLVYGIIRLINFAHGEVFMVGAFVAYFLFSNTPFATPQAVLSAGFAAMGVFYVLRLWRGRSNDPLAIGGALLAAFGIFFALKTETLSWIPALFLSMLITGVVGILLDRVAYRPLRSAPRISLLITAIAMSFLMQNAGLLVFSRELKQFRPNTDIPTPLQFSLFGQKVESWTGPLNFKLGGGSMYTTTTVFLTIVVTLILVVALTLFVNRTRLGRAMRACAQDPDVARMMGVNVNRVIATTFFLGSMLAAAAGVLWGLSYGTISQPSIMGVLPGIKAFAAAVIGGIGSLPGAVIGGVVLGFLENFVPALSRGTTEYRDALVFILLIVILLIKPSGIIGEDLSEKV